VIGAAPLLTHALPFTAENNFLKETINSATTLFQHSNEYFRFGPCMFLQFCNQAPGYMVIRSFDFRAFSGLILGFGLFQLSP
jgi:hypothetical protein